MGKSRSAALLIAFLLYTTIHTATPLTPQSALALIRQTRSFAEPNSGFMEQLELYHSMGCPSDLDNEPTYQRWLWKKTVKESTDAGMAPELEGVKFEDEVKSGVDSEPLPQSNVPREPGVSYRCRRCRTSLATSAHLVTHRPKNEAPPCAHLHITPLSWMRPELEQGKLEGRLECPNRKCEQSVGRYAWQGIKCSCGDWVVPGMTLGRGRVDEVRERKGVGGGGRI
ncbi:tyrosine protein phosphatase yvh1 [Lecanora helva]